MDVQAVSDASSMGWGFVGLTGTWDSYLANHPSNVREMTAVLIASTFVQEGLGSQITGGVWLCR